MERTGLDLAKGGPRIAPQPCSHHPGYWSAGRGAVALVAGAPTPAPSLLSLVIFLLVAGAPTPAPPLFLAGYFSVGQPGRYDPWVFGIAGRRIAEALVALFALLGFVFVPLGQKTALEHTFAIFSTPPAVGAFHELAGTVLRLKDRIVKAVAPPPAPKNQPKPEIPKLPERTARRR